jgi:hypothetical protein
VASDSGRTSHSLTHSLTPKFFSGQVVGVKNSVSARKLFQRPLANNDLFASSFLARRFICVADGSSGAIWWIINIDDDDDEID